MSNIILKIIRQAQNQSMLRALLLDVTGSSAKHDLSENNWLPASSVATARQG